MHTHTHTLSLSFARSREHGTGRAGSQVGKSKESNGYQKTLRVGSWIRLTFLAEPFERLLAEHVSASSTVVTLLHDRLEMVTEEDWLGSVLP